MASKSSTTTLALFLALNLLFFTLATSCSTCPPAPKPPCPTPKPPTPTPKPPTPTPKPTPSSSKCPINTLKLGVCANVLGLVNLNLGKAPKTPCCSLLQNLVDLEAAVCLCTALKANVLGVHLNVPIKLGFLLNYCGKNVPSGFQCA